jgi:hypothetical protein
MITTIEIKVSKAVRGEYSTSIEELGRVHREFHHNVPAKVGKSKALEALEEARQEVIEIFNREIEAEEVAAAKAKAEMTKTQT